MNKIKFIILLVLGVLLFAESSPPMFALSHEVADDHTLDIVAAQERAKMKMSAFKDKVYNDFDEYEERILAEYKAYKDSVLNKFVEYMKRPWLDVEGQKLSQKPLDRSIKPEVIDNNKNNIIDDNYIQKCDDDKVIEKSNDDNSKQKAINYDEVVDLSRMELDEQPQPFVPIILEQDDLYQYFEFDFFSTRLKVHISDEVKCKLLSVDNNGIADFIGKMSKNESINLTLADCLDLRDDLMLCDWAYLELLMTLTTTFYGEMCNESTLLAGYLYSMSGYKMRYAYSSNGVELLFACDQLIVDMPMYVLNSKKNDRYFMIGSNKVESLKICDFKIPYEKPMSLYMNNIPILREANVCRSIELHSYPINLEYIVNQNLIDFFDTYPTPLTVGDEYSKWSYYAKTPLSDVAKELLYPTLELEISGLSDCEAVNILMNWIQTYEYQYDNDVWGYDRAFFPDETLFYPYCDCEDRSILLARIVMDLLNLQTAIIYYPNHLAVAIQFNENVDGDYIVYDGKRFTICDPTYKFSRAGQTMKGMNNNQAKLILL